MRVCNSSSQERVGARNSNLEMLRIVSMFLIVAHHYAMHGFNIAELNYSFNRYIVGVLSLGGKLGVSCFILISGFFMVNFQITLHKLIKIIAEVWVYSAGITLLFMFVLTPEETLNIKKIV